MYGSLVAGVDPRPKAYAFMAGTIRFSDWFRFGSDLDEEALAAYAEKMDFLDPIKHIAQAQASVFFQFADDDFYVPIERAERFFEAANDPKQVSFYSAKHSVVDAENTARRDRMAWVRGQLA